MKITGIRTTPLLVPYKVPYHWARGVEEGATVVLVEVESDGGIVGFGESLGAPDADADARAAERYRKGV